MSSKLTFKGYTKDPQVYEKGDTYRAAHALDWAASDSHHKGEPITYNLLYKIVQGLAALPQLKNQKVEHFRKSMPRVRQLLASEYHRGFVIVPGVGVRATYDHLDQLEHGGVPRLVKREIAIQKALAVELSLVDRNKIPDTKANKASLDYLDGLKAYNRQMEGGLLQKLLSPIMKEEGVKIDLASAIKKAKSDKKEE
jgi:hypothetical protein